MTDRRIHKLLTFLIAGMWLWNGLFCKILNLVPRHQQIVAGILGEEYSRPLIIAIGLAEIFMAIWILSGIRSRLNAVLQISVVAVMNVLEFLWVPDLLLWGRVNSFFAVVFILLVYYNEFILNKPVAQRV